MSEYSCPIRLSDNGIEVENESSCPLRITGSTEEESDTLRVAGTILIEEWERIAADLADARKVARVFYRKSQGYTHRQLEVKEFWPWLEEESGSRPTVR